MLQVLKMMEQIKMKGDSTICEIVNGYFLSKFDHVFLSANH